MSNVRPMVSVGNSLRVRYSAAYPTGRERMREPRYGYHPSRRRVAVGDALAGVRELIVKVTPFVLILQKWQTARPRDEQIASEL